MKGIGDEWCGRFVVGIMGRTSYAVGGREGNRSVMEGRNAGNLLGTKSALTGFQASKCSPASRRINTGNWRTRARNCG